MTVGLMRHRVFHDIRGDIMSCDLRPGEELRESELARRYGVSKSPVRDALQKLEFEGLVEIVPRRGHRVAPISMRDAEDILEMRVILEVGAVRKIARDASEKVLARMDEFRHADTTDIQAFTEYNHRFHHALASASGNLRLAEDMRRLMDNYDRLCIVSLVAAEEDDVQMEVPLAEHIEIIDALQSRNGALAGRIVTKHVHRSRGNIMKGLESRAIVA